MQTESANRPSFVVRIIQAALISLSVIAVIESASIWYISESLDPFIWNPLIALLFASTFAVPLFAAYGVANKSAFARYLAGLVLAFTLINLTRGLMWNVHYCLMNFSSPSGVSASRLAWTVYGMANFGLVVVALPSLIFSKDVRNWFSR